MSDLCPLKFPRCCRKNYEWAESKPDKKGIETFLKFFSLEAVIRLTSLPLISFSLTKFRSFYSLTRTEFRRTFRTFSDTISQIYGSHSISNISVNFVFRTHKIPASIVRINYRNIKSFYKNCKSDYFLNINIWSF